MPHPIADAMHQLCIALHTEKINPAEIEIALPREAWWHLQCRLASLNPSLSRFDGRGELATCFQYIGVTFKVKSD